MAKFNSGVVHTIEFLPELRRFPISPANKAPPFSLSLSCRCLGRMCWGWGWGTYYNRYSRFDSESHSQQLPA